MNRPTKLEDMPSEMATFATTSKLAQSDTQEWLIFHSFLSDEDSGKCAISPPMLALTWEMAQTVFNSLLEAALENMSQQYDRAYFARIEDSGTELRVGVFDQLNEQAYPKEVISLMDRRALSMELYRKYYYEHATGITTVSELPMPTRAQAAKTVIH